MENRTNEEKIIDVGSSTCGQKIMDFKSLI